MLSLLNDKKFALSTDEGDIDGWTPLHWACRQDHVGVVETLLDRQQAAADGSKSASRFIWRATKDGWTPQNISIIHGARQVADFLQQRLPKAEQESYKFGLVPGSVEKRPRKGRRWKTWRAHSGVSCNGCFLEPLVGVRWCCQGCQNFDYCFKCFWTVESTHDSKHVFKPFADWEEARDIKEPETEDDEADARSEGSDESW